MEFRKPSHRGSQFKFILGEIWPNFLPHGEPQKCNFLLWDLEWLVLFKKLHKSGHLT